MNTSGWLQLAFFSIVLLALTKPMGLYLVRVLDAERPDLPRSGLKAGGAPDLSPCRASIPPKSRIGKVTPFPS